MDTKSFIRNNLELSTKNVLSKFEGLEAAETTFPTANGGCHPLWILGHLAQAEGEIIHSTMLGEQSPVAELDDLFKGGTEPQADTSIYPARDELMAKCKMVRDKTMAMLDSMSEEELDMPSKMVPEGLEAEFGTRRECFQFISNHWWMHRAHLTDAKRSAGLLPEKV